MCQPISFNVIRQVLEWHGFPVPSLRLLSFSDTDPEVVVAEYLALWPISQLPRKYFVDPVRLRFGAVGEIQRDLQTCFCQDVTVLNVVQKPVHGLLSAVLYMQVGRSTLALAAISTRDDA